MIVYTRITLDSETGKILRRRGYSWTGPIALCKGDSTAKQAETDQLNFNEQLMNLFTQQYGTQQAQLKYLQSKMQPIIDAGGQGMSPEALAAARTAATDTTSQEYQNAQAALNQQEGGNSKLANVAGATTEANAALLNSEAAQKAKAQEDITMQNEQLKQQNYWNAINALNGVSAQENPLGYAGEATSGGNTVAGLSQAYKSSQSSQLLGALGGIAGGAVSGWALGGFHLPGGSSSGEPDIPNI